MYILASIISSLCVAKTIKKSVTERKTDEEKKEDDSSYTPAALQKNTPIASLQMYKSVSVFIQINNFQANPLNILQNVLCTWKGDASQAFEYIACPLV